MVMHLSCSSFRVSVNRVSPALAEAMMPALHTSESVSVDLPWSTWAITDMFLMLDFLSMIARIWSTVKFTWGGKSTKLEHYLPRKTKGVCRLHSKRTRNSWLPWHYGKRLWRFKSSVGGITQNGAFVDFFLQIFWHCRQSSRNGWNAILLAARGTFGWYSPPFAVPTNPWKCVQKLSQMYGAHFQASECCSGKEGDGESTLHDHPHKTRLGFLLLWFGMTQIYKNVYQNTLWKVTFCDHVLWKAVIFEDTM